MVETHDYLHYFIKLDFRLIPAKYKIMIAVEDPKINRATSIPSLMPLSP